jgi:N-acetylglucosaminyldiphosphoundecaprenol N-acetyl-beta-D-mannosaminyltransferase
MRSGSVAILGVPIDNVTMREALLEMEAMIDARGFHQIATANVDFLINSIHDSELKEILANCDLVLPDGMPLVWASRMMGASLQERVTGAELVPKLVELSAMKKYGIYLLGANEASSRGASNWIETNYPQARLVGRHCPPWAELDQMDHAEMLHRIEAARPDILLVAFGSPKQEKWLAMHRNRLRVPVCIGVGGSLDMLSGVVPRAPLWMQSHGLEWLFRAYREPARLALRYARDASGLLRYLPLQLAAAAAQRDGSALNSITEETIGSATVLHVSGSLRGYPVSGFESEARLAVEDGHHLVLDLAGVSCLGSDALGTLIRLDHDARHRNREMWLTGLRPSSSRTIEAAQLHARFRTAPKVSDALRRIHPADMQMSIEAGTDWALVRVSGQLIPIAKERVEELCRELLRTVGKDSRVPLMAELPIPEMGFPPAPEKTLVGAPAGRF